jgi:hypothetical protein
VSVPGADVDTSAAARASLAILFPFLIRVQRDMRRDRRETERLTREVEALLDQRTARQT